MSVTFPASPSLGDRHSYAGQTWEWNGSAWALEAPDYFAEFDPLRTYHTGECFVWPGRSNSGGSHVYQVTVGPTTPGMNPGNAGTAFAEILSATGRMRGYMDPNAINGGSTVPAPVVDGNPGGIYAPGDYLICVSDSNQLYNTATGQPTTGPTAIGFRLFRGDRMSMNAVDNWERLESNDVTAWGVFDATVAGGGTGVPQPVIDGSRWYRFGDHVIVGRGGRYNFATGQPDPAQELLVEGQSLVYNAVIWQATRSLRQRFVGFFDPTVDGGGVDVPDPIIDGTADYVAGDYAIAGADGSYDFNTGIAGAGANARLVSPSDHILYDGALWEVLTSANSPDRGYFNPNNTGGQPPAPFPVLNGTSDYFAGDFVTCMDAGTYDFTTGQPDPGGTPIALGERVYYSGAIWFPLAITTGLMKGQFDPTVNNGGPRVDFPVVNNSTDYQDRDMVLATASGYYHFGTGVTGNAPGAVWVWAGETWTIFGGAWGRVSTSGDSNKGWFDPAAAGGGTGFPAVTNSTTHYADNDWFTVLRDGNYDFVTGAPSAGGTALSAGDVLRRDTTNLRWEIYAAGASSGGGTQTLDVTQNAHGFAVGQPIYINSAGVWAKALATGAGTLKHATVAEVTSANNFKAMFSGLLRMPAHSLVRGAMYYLSTTAGGYLTTAPTMTGQFVQPHLTPVSANEVMIHDGQMVRRI